MLYLVATPIGNLGDMSQRAIDTLREVDIIISEEPRKTGVLLKHFEVKKPQMSFHEHNERKVLPKVMALLEKGKTAALVTSAGSPSISDPGYILVRSVIDAGISVTAIPGPTAIIPALALSGLPVHSFTFRGFPPRKSGPRKRFYAVDNESPHTLIFYESPHRIIASMKDALEVLGDRPAAIANDLTKMFETIERGMLTDLLQWLETADLRGEFTVVIAGKESRKR